MAKQLFVNNFRATLAGALALGATSVTLSPAGVGAKLGSITNGDYYLLTVAPADNSESSQSVLKVTAVAGDVVTIDPAPAAWPANSLAEVRIPATYLQALSALLDTVTGVGPGALYEIADWINNTDRPNFKVGMYGGKHDVMPIRPQRRRCFGNWRLKTDVYNATGSYVDVVRPTPLYGVVGGTEVQLTLATGNSVACAFDVSQIKGAGSEIDVTNSIIGFNFRGILNTNMYVSTFNIQLFDSGSPAAVPASYLQSNSTGFEMTNWSTNEGSTPGREQCIGIDINQFTMTGTVDPTKIKWARVNIGASGGSITIAPYSIDCTPRASNKARLMLSFDDGSYAQYSFLAPLLQRFGMRATAYLSPLATIAGTTNTANVTTQQIINLLEQFGWQIGSQGFTTEASTILSWTNDQLTSEGRKLRAMHSALGVWGGIDGSYFGGVNHGKVAVYDPLFRRNFRTMRSFRNGRAVAAGAMTPIGETLPPRDPSIIRAFNFSSGYATGDAFTMWKGLLDQAEANKGICALVGHGEFTSTSSTLYPDLVNFLAYAESRIAAGAIECATIGEIVQLCNMYA